MNLVTLEDIRNYLLIAATVYHPVENRYSLFHHSRQRKRLRRGMRGYPGN